MAIVGFPVRSRPRDLARPQKRRDAVTAHEEDKKGAHSQGEERGKAAVELFDRLIGGGQGGDGKHHEQKAYYFMPESMYGFYDRRDYMPDELPAFGADTRFHHIFMLTKVVP
jgi:hypothetical protein